MAYLNRVDRCDLEALKSALAWGTVTASCTIEAFGLEGLRGLDLAALEKRLDVFRSATHFE
jgi:hypothetical protein